jgi:hypothetical protein
MRGQRARPARRRGLRKRTVGNGGTALRPDPAAPIRASRQFEVSADGRGMTVRGHGVAGPDRGLAGVDRRAVGIVGWVSGLADP